VPTPIKFTVTVDEYGEAQIRVPPGLNQQRNAGVIAKFTEKLAGLLGKIKERHVGTPMDNHHHVHSDGSVHENH